MPESAAVIGAARPAQPRIAPPCRPDALPLDDVIAVVAARRDLFHRLSHVPRDVVELFKRAGLYRAGTPPRFGGHALPPAACPVMIDGIDAAMRACPLVATIASSA
ncbi:flavin-dependent monooxygenase, partial [Burkholderia pseudomallei]|nr:flavin-dependent monooxygenase [Burkholderia pseudomallei]